ncbi:transcription-repair coupling factor [Akkermansia glycaniphila]|uniref:transcription-repair coupling factor n=1 Tax=Akkermansia glycaniphila TaxID=1679444 RepID=UPI001C01017C|nr:transcription-repair coupling factor [Akkermansia glycaniphila]MBT9450214.1 transcription-repair coupling factor [Akkermansia glycaniphila]
MIQELLARVARTAAFRRKLSVLGKENTRNTPVIFEQTPPAALSFLISLIASTAGPKQRIWILTPDLPRQERLAAELPIWKQGHTLFLPEQEIHINNGLSDPDLLAERLDILQKLSLPPEERQLVVLTETALTQDAPASSTIEEQTSYFSIGDTIEQNALIAMLTEAGFERSDQVIARGQWSIRGGIVDVFPLQAPHPLRIELFGDTIESIRAFDIDSQLSFKKLKGAQLLLSEPPAKQKLKNWISLNDWIISTPDCRESGNIVILETPTEDIPDAAELDSPQNNDKTAFYGTPLGSFDTGDFVMQEAKRNYAHGQLEKWNRQAWEIAIFFPHPGEEKRFREICGNDPAWERVHHCQGELPHGFTAPGAKLAVLSSSELFGRYTTPQARKRADREDAARRERAQTPLREILPGDLVIHASHGLGKYIGIDKSPDTGEEEMYIEYRGGVKLGIPIRQSHLVSKYIGLGTKTPELSKLGDAKWVRACKAAEKAVADYAAQLLEVQAERETNQGYAHPADSAWMWEFESSFPYRETPDQLRAIQQAKADMESPRPMDRLICGDVGFGKTEVAIRAAFKCITGGKQAAILVPTTVLADQHGRSFKARMSEYPVRIEVLSRFTPAKKEKEILQGLANGSVDIVVGTHRLISKDIRFKNLGLVVIDEEQRFGVRHKEQFKTNFRAVDMLTLSATPIPRTLYIALMGARDMSTIDTAPLNRLPVQTAVCPYDEKLIKDAIERELNRGGQVFFLHNRVQTIDHMAHQLHQLVPKARIVIGHGQMDKSDLEDVMGQFVRGEADILLSTTIIESGIDIPNANTIIIDRADRFGLADLYQLRGRVGRAGHRAYAYLLLPRHALTTGDARKRVSAIKQYTELGSGFKIAMRDLEIRGAGNLLGTQQSGHIAAIGFELYCQLLRQSIERLQGKTPTLRTDSTLKADFICWSEAKMTIQESRKGIIGAYLPAAYMESTRTRIAAYKDLANATHLNDLGQLQKHWIDRFGSLPAEAENLLQCQRIKLLASRANIAQVEIVGQKLMLTRNRDYILLEGRFPRLKKLHPVDKLREVLELLLTL